MSARRDHSDGSSQAGDSPAEPRSCAQETRSARTRQAIYEAAVKSLDAHGYAETSVMKVQSLAGVSRGAITHQYPTKESLIVAVAEQLLDEIRHIPAPKAGPRLAGEEGYLEWLLLFTLGRFFDTAEGRALTEIFQAMRTDQSLCARLAPAVTAWDALIEAWYTRRLKAQGGDAEVREFIRLFLYLGRGMLVSGPFDDLSEREALVRKLAALGAPRIKRRSEADRAAASNTNEREALGPFEAAAE